MTWNFVSCDKKYQGFCIVVVVLLAFEEVILGFYLGNTGSGKRRMDGNGDVMFASWWRRCGAGSGIKAQAGMLRYFNDAEFCLM